MIKSPPKVMTFSATDPTGGAGLQADILTLASIYCHPISITTAITVQDTTGVELVSPVDSQLLKQQAITVLKDVEVAVFKLGLLGSIENIKAISEIKSSSSCPKTEIPARVYKECKATLSIPLQLLWKKSFEVNVDAPFVLCQNILEVMKKQKSGSEQSQVSS